MGSHRALLSECSAELREKGSRFLAVVRPVEDIAAARAVRAELAREHLDASHHCWAERIGWPPEERSSDAGEPHGTAGEPIARALRSHELSDVVAVVIRWFGGTKLGKGGLVRAYRGAVVAALESGTFEDRHPMTVLRVRVPYGKVGAVKRLIRPGEVELLSESYTEDVVVELRLRRNREESLREALADAGIAARAASEDHS